MTEFSRHGQWLSLIDVSGPFLAEPVLKQVFPQGLEQTDPLTRKHVRQAYDEWREAVDSDDSQSAAIHDAWIDLVLKKTLELDEDDERDVLKPESELPDSLSVSFPEHDVTLRPDFAVINAHNDSQPLMFVAVYAPDTELSAPVKGGKWAASPAERMVELCRAQDVRLGLVTNGERWMLVDAPIGGVTSFASWYARLWTQEAITLQAFINLLGIRRFFVDDSERLPALLDESLKLQDEVTDALGEQVRRAVEVLVQALDRADVDRNRELLAGVEPPELYEAALTVLMRIVFLLSAEERGLLLLDDERYQEYYAVSTLRMQLRAESEEILERRQDAWSRLLAIFRAVFGGIEHEALKLPALGGSLFDPDRFPFLEGRAKDTSWKDHSAAPLPIDNRTVLLLLDAVQLFEGRTLSYRALDIEQIGYVYEGLLERTVVRAPEVTLDLDATKSAKMPWVTLDELETAATEGDDAVRALLGDRTGSSASRVKNDLAKQVDKADTDRLLTACHGDQNLRDRIKPYLNFLRADRWGYPLVYPEGTFMVTTGADRRETGTHYTPKSLTEAIVKETLEPLVYVGPAESKPREDWTLKPPRELLDLKVCDPAMGSGAFLVQVCRWLSERLVEAWSQVEATGKAITAEGKVVDEIAGLEPLRADVEDRVLTARRLIAERCLYGVDVNPLAVELAKLSIWLVTLAKGRPFGFLDHNFRTGDSLLGMHALDQLLYLDMKPGKGSSKKLFAKEIDQAIETAIEVRAGIRSRPIRDIRDVQAMAAMDEEAREKLELPGLIADTMIGDVLAADGRPPDTAALSIEAGEAITGDASAVAAMKRRATLGLRKDLADSKPTRRPFHWPLEFPEVFSGQRCGFDAIVGNPPFLGGKRISGAHGASYQKYLVRHVTLNKPSSVDLVVHFFLRAFDLLDADGCFGLLGRRSINEAKNCDVGLRQILGRRATIYSANTNIPWAGKAAVVVHQIHVTKRRWQGTINLDGRKVNMIGETLSDSAACNPDKLAENLGLTFQGTILSGEGFKISEETALSFLEIDSSYEDVVFPFIGGNEINKDPHRQPICWVICFWDWPEDRARQFVDAFEVVEREVYPKRQKQKDNGAKKYWWQYLRPRPELYHAIGRGEIFENHPEDWNPSAERLSRVLVISTGTTKYPAFTFLPSNMIYSNKLCVLADDRYSMFAILSSDFHSVWAWHQKTTLQADMESMRYAHGNIFETFPFPNGFFTSNHSGLGEKGREFFEARQSYMEEHTKGLTKFYNDFHDPGCNDGAIVACRDLQMQINDAVLAAYGFDDINLDIGFHEVGYLPADKNTRYTMGEEARQDILSRLALLNKERHEDQSKNGGAGKRGTSMKVSSVDALGDLFAARRGGA